MAKGKKQQQEKKVIITSFENAIYCNQFYFIFNLYHSMSDGISRKKYENCKEWHFLLQVIGFSIDDLYLKITFERIFVRNEKFKTTVLLVLYIRKTTTKLVSDFIFCAAIVGFREIKLLSNELFKKDRHRWGSSSE